MDTDALKRLAGEEAAALVQDGMVVGLGTGSTAACMVDALIRRVAQGLKIVGVPTSIRTAEQAQAGGIPLTDLGAHPRIDLTIDGADQVERGTLNLIKGMGGALLREKLVAAASDRLVIIVDDRKLSENLSLPVPVEVVPFGWQATDLRIQALGGRTVLRGGADGTPYVTDNHNYILDVDFGVMGGSDPSRTPEALDAALREIVGVVETGFFIHRAETVIIAGEGGVTRWQRSA
ncbi:Ribose 5-phosphate isomerase [Granulibacter bethesdensis]|uniref:Ribose-5-phosphate isomerase A n=1 Tax=Granulibacter bethesdensis TaxID=364410 RepID=A0AAC9P823_9PROT|nr:ribose-5-phosphate isomerase RpiA [Granulibacter bethesdensis]APH54111.1 Ribose 5-phosphate isomerase [Granulibacter bethesdensis]APH61693.1 Ribose 5-phosphate isomerase [Granulibacter bethesdensis]